MHLQRNHRPRLTLSCACTTLRPPPRVKAPFTPCDDTNLCTQFDHCVADPDFSDGGCVGRKYRTCLNSDFTEDETRNCQECDGNGGCVDKEGHFSGPGAPPALKPSCGCMIDGVFYYHNQRNPSNDCQQCNVAPPNSNTDWTDLFDDPCEYSDMCTVENKCRADPVLGVSCQPGDWYPCEPDLAGTYACAPQATYPCVPLACSARAECAYDDLCQQVRLSLVAGASVPRGAC